MAEIFIRQFIDDLDGKPIDTELEHEVSAVVYKELFKSAGKRVCHERLFVGAPSFTRLTGIGVKPALGQSIHPDLVPPTGPAVWSSPHPPICSVLASFATRSN